MPKLTNSDRASTQQAMGNENEMTRLAMSKVKFLEERGGSVVVSNGITTILRFKDGKRASVDRFARVEWYGVNKEAKKDVLLVWFGVVVSVLAIAAGLYLRIFNP